MNKIHLTVGLLALAAVMALGIDWIREAVVDSRVNKPLVDVATLTRVDQIEASSAAATFTLSRGEGDRWVVKGTDEFPANGTKIATLMDAFARVILERQVARNAKAGDGFGMDTATTLTFRQGANELLKVRLGGKRSGGGQYLSLGGKNVVYLVGQDLAFDPDEESWELKTVLSLPKLQIKELSFTPARTDKTRKAVVLTRGKPEDVFAVAGISPAESPREDALKSVEGLLEEVAFTKRVDPSNVEASAALTDPARLVATLFDGRQIQLDMGHSGEKETAKVFVMASILPGTASPEVLNASENQRLTTLLGKWRFELGSYVASRFEKGRDDFVSKK